MLKGKIRYATKGDKASYYLNSSLKEFKGSLVLFLQGETVANHTPALGTSSIELSHSLR